MEGNQNKGSALSSLPPQANEIKLDGDKIFLKFQGDPQSEITPIMIDPAGEGIEVKRFPTFSHQGKAAVDHDGSPTAYMPGDRGTDYLANGFKGADYFGFDPRAINEDGGYVSKTKWNNGGDPKRQSSYVDSRRVPYVVVPDKYLQEGGKMGDFVRLRNRITKREIWAVVADSRKNVKEVEFSIAAAKLLDVGFNRVGTTKNYQDITMVAYRGSASGRWY